MYESIIQWLYVVKCIHFIVLYTVTVYYSGCIARLYLNIVALCSEMYNSVALCSEMYTFYSALYSNCILQWLYLVK
jgi:hypothetical protein